MTQNRTLIPVYTSRGDLGAFLAYPYLYSCMGEWIGFVTAEREVYSVYGSYVGHLTGEPRILRKKNETREHNHRTIPIPPGKITVPAHVPLAPMMAEIRFDTMDVLEEDPDLLPTIDFGEERQDLD
jgi:hypothetical protein